MTQHPLPTPIYGLLSSVALATWMTNEMPSVSSLIDSSEHETLAEYDQTLRTLYKQGWPEAPKAQKDSDLKQQFEEGVTSHDLAQYLKLFTRSLSYAETVQQARRYVTTTEPTRTKKIVRVSTPPSHPSINLVDDGDRP